MDNKVNTMDDSSENEPIIDLLVSLAVLTVITFFVQYPVFVVLKQPPMMNFWGSLFYSFGAFILMIVVYGKNDIFDLYEDDRSCWISMHIMSLIVAITLCAFMNSIFANLFPATDIFVSINGYERDFKLEDVPLYNMIGANDKVEYIIKYNGDASVVTDNINDIVEDGKIKYRYGNWNRLLSDDEADRAVQDLNKIKGIYSICWKIGLGLIILWRICIFALIIKKKLADLENADKIEEQSKTKKE